MECEKVEKKENPKTARSVCVYVCERDTPVLPSAPVLESKERMGRFGCDEVKLLGDTDHSSTSTATVLK